MSKNINAGYRKFLFAITGIFVLLFGITLILVFWTDVVSLFRGASGIVIAIAGLVILYMLNK